MPVTNYIWDVESDNLLMETDGDGATTGVYTNEPGRFGQLVSQRRGGVTSYHHFDGQGSTRQLTDQSGNVTDTATYSAFGETVASSGITTNPFGYKGALGYYANPETSDLYVRARTYDPIIARWLSQDPFGLLGGQQENWYRLVMLESGRFASWDPIVYGGGVNLYRYVANGPTNAADPTGMVIPGPEPSPWPKAPPQKRRPGTGRIEIAPGPGCTDERFMKWYHQELADVSIWTARLKPCPCNMICYQACRTYNQRGELVEYKNEKSMPCNTDPENFDDTSVQFRWVNWLFAFHPGGCYELRTKTSGPGTQCVYDCQGYLITTPPGAGSADRASPSGGGFDEHQVADVSPYECARELNEKYGTTKYTSLYYAVRPANSGKPCTGGNRVLPSKIVGRRGKPVY